MTAYFSEQGLRRNTQSLYLTLFRVYVIGGWQTTFFINKLLFTKFINYFLISFQRKLKVKAKLDILVRYEIGCGRYTK